MTMFRWTLGASLIAAGGLTGPGMPKSEMPLRRVPAVAAAPVTVSRPLTREVLWNPDLEKQSPFGFIPTEWTVRPQLLPGHWDVKTVLASGDADGERGSKRTSR
jgi:hypothetical protein